MSMPIKGSRKIVVDGNEFIWKVKKHPSHNERHNVDYLVPVQHISGGQIVLLSIGYNRSGYSSRNTFTITPSIISKCIKFAIAQGWQFKEKLSTLEIDCSSVIQEEPIFLTKMIIDSLRNINNPIAVEIADEVTDLLSVGEYKIALENTIDKVCEYHIPLSNDIISAAMQAFRIWKNYKYLLISNQLKYK